MRRRRRRTPSRHELVSPEDAADAVIRQITSMGVIPDRRPPEVGRGVRRATIGKGPPRRPRGVPGRDSRRRGSEWVSARPPRASCSARILIRFSNPVANTPRTHRDGREHAWRRSPAVAGGITNGLSVHGDRSSHRSCCSECRPGSRSEPSIPPRWQSRSSTVSGCCRRSEAAGSSRHHGGDAGRRSGRCSARGALVRFLPARALGLAVGGLLLMLQPRARLGLSTSDRVDGSTRCRCARVFIAACRPIASRWRTGNTETPAKKKKKKKKGKRVTEAGVFITERS